METSEIQRTVTENGLKLAIEEVRKLEKLLKEKRAVVRTLKRLINTWNQETPSEQQSTT